MKTICTVRLPLSDQTPLTLFCVVWCELLCAMRLPLNDQTKLFYLTTPLKHIDFHIIGYWTWSIWSLWHISVRWNLLSPHRLLFLISSQGSFLYPLSQRQDITYHSLWWTGCGPLVVMENSPNCICICHAGLIHHAGWFQTFTAECSTAWATSRSLEWSSSTHSLSALWGLKNC